MKNTMTRVDYECAIALLNESGKIKDEELARALKRVAKLERLLARLDKLFTCGQRITAINDLAIEARRIQKRLKRDKGKQ